MIIVNWVFFPFDPYRNKKKYGYTILQPYTSVNIIMLVCKDVDMGGK